MLTAAMKAQEEKKAAAMKAREEKETAAMQAHEEKKAKKAAAMKAQEENKPENHEICRELFQVSSQHLTVASPISHIPCQEAFKDGKRVLPSAVEIPVPIYMMMAGLKEGFVSAISSTCNS